MTVKYRILKHKIASAIKNFNTSTQSKCNNIGERDESSFLLLISAILHADDNFNKIEFKHVATAINNEIPTRDINSIIELLEQKYTNKTITSAASNLSHLNLAVKELLLQSLIELACANNRYTIKEQKLIDTICIEFSISETHAYELWKKAEKKTQKKNNIIGSGTALAIVLVIIIIFVLAASFFLSIIFGLILAYFFLPVQYWFKNTLFSSKLARGISIITSIITSPITYPLKKISCILPKTKKLDDEPQLKIEELKELNQIKHSCRYTVLLVITVLLIFITAATLFSTTYFNYATKSMTNWAKQTSKNFEKHIEEQKKYSQDTISNTNTKKSLIVNTPSLDSAKEKIGLNDNKTNSEPRDFFQALLYKLESIKPKLDKIPFFKEIKITVAKYLKDPENVKKLSLLVLKNTGGVFSYTAGAIGMIFMLLMNLVLAFFFFAFFLGHMAQFNNAMDEKATAGEHIVNGILNSGWLPDTNKDTRQGSIVILNNIFSRLRSWIRGYLTIIIIETIFYVTTFLLIGVPYGIILGLIAGLTILLPYIGTMISVSLTVTVCLAVGTGGMVQVVIVLMLFTIMGGIIEQLFIYPAVVGRSLGLNEFETIVLVLLGGILFGIPGMIFAVPVASILKYLIPQVYKFVQNQKAQKNHMQSELE